MAVANTLQYCVVSQYYYLVAGQNGEQLLAPRADAPGRVTPLAALAKYPRSVYMGATRAAYGRVWWVLHTKQDLEPEYDVRQIDKYKFSIVDRRQRRDPLKAGTWYGKKLRPDNFEGIPMAGVSWLDDRLVWKVTHNGKGLGTYKDYYEACNVRLRALDYREPNYTANDGGDIYPAPRTMWHARAKAGKVPHGYKTWITYSKQQGFYRLQKDGKTVKCSHDLSTLTKEVDKWKVQK